MPQRAIPIILVLWAAAAVAWALLRESPSGEESAVAGAGQPGDRRPHDPLTVQPALEPQPGAGPPAVPPGKTASVKVPQHILRLNDLRNPKNRALLLEWLRADPGHLIAYLEALYGHYKSGMLWLTPYRSTQRWFATFGDELRFLLPVLRQVVAHGKADRRVTAGVFGILTAMGQAAAAEYGAVRAFAEREELDYSLRVLAASTLVALDSDADATRGAIALVIAQYRTYGRVALRVLVARVGTLGKDGAPFIPSLLELYPKVRGDRLLEIHVVSALASTGNRDTRVLRVMAENVNSAYSTVRSIARRSLKGLDTNALIAFFETAKGRARVEGVALLLEKGVAGERLVELLLPALKHDDAQTRARAVQLLPKVVKHARDALPIVRELFASDDPARWLTGTRALGALGTAPHDREDVIQLLFTAVRLRDAKVRKIAVQSLLMFDDKADAVIALLGDLLDDTETDVRREAVDGLGELSANNAKARALVARALKDSDESVRALARYWLEQDEDDG